MLRTIADDVWAYEKDFRMPVGYLPARATVVRRADGGIVLHSPLAFDDATARAIDALGEVRAIVAPSRLHHVFVKAAAERWPRASVLGAPGLEKKLSGVPFAPLPRSGAAPELGDDLTVRLVEGVPYITEHVFLHARSRTLIVTDLLFNVHEVPSIGMKVFLWLGGAWKKTAQDHVWRVLTRDRAAAARSVADVLAWDFERIVVAHGDVIEGDAKDRARRALAWMGGGAAPLPPAT
ncbi:hypothetical protein BE21_49025 [Sorangium cellulosum]|uniref:DUF4336 domain-containing protein n=1 Tax=Sorangium cellulosum TaxID=56 RepID=A0A150TH92_SORCE|nr:hypothetical protein BE21_49025 [Sorangium cellulosum]